jgi:hypothetical protein
VGLWRHTLCRDVMDVAMALRGPSVTLYAAARAMAQLSVVGVHGACGKLV